MCVSERYCHAPSDRIFVANGRAKGDTRSELLFVICKSIFCTKDDDDQDDTYLFLKRVAIIGCGVIIHSSVIQMKQCSGERPSFTLIKGAGLNVFLSYFKSFLSWDRIIYGRERETREILGGGSG